MVTIKHGLAAIAAFGMTVSPAFAETRSAQALPAPSAQVDSSAVSLASQPMEDASSLHRRGGLFGGGVLSPAVLIALLAIIAAIIAASSGGGNDSPG